MISACHWRDNVSRQCHNHTFTSFPTFTLPFTHFSFPLRCGRAFPLLSFIFKAMWPRGPSILLFYFFKAASGGRPFHHFLSNFQFSHPLFLVPFFPTFLSKPPQSLSIFKSTKSIFYFVFPTAAPPQCHLKRRPAGQRHRRAVNENAAFAAIV